MVIKISKKYKSKEIVRYKGIKNIITSQDINEANRFDDKLNKTIKHIECILLDSNVLSGKNVKIDPIKTWYIIGGYINHFLKENPISKDDDNFFWESLYGRSRMINKNIPLNKIGEARNDFKISSLLAMYPLEKIKKIGPWSLWREILTSKAFMKDKRVLDWVLKKLEKYPPKTRNDARPFFKAVSSGLKRIDTTVLNDKELLEKLERIKRSNHLFYKENYVICKPNTKSFNKTKR